METHVEDVCQRQRRQGNVVVGHFGRIERVGEGQRLMLERRKCIALINDRQWSRYKDRLKLNRWVGFVGVAFQRRTKTSQASDAAQRLKSVAVQGPPPLPSTSTGSNPQNEQLLYGH